MKQDSVKAFAEAINKRAGSLDILVNNAGLGYTKKSFTEQGVGMLTQVRRAAVSFLLTTVVEVMALVLGLWSQAWDTPRKASQSRA
jgi:NAD(P)-dependent dehydrogenase (short-subunit alcohol dehydrogenase family)